MGLLATVFSFFGISHIAYDESAHCLVFQTVLKKTESCRRYAFFPAFISATEEIIASIMKSTCSFVRP